MKERKKITNNQQKQNKILQTIKKLEWQKQEHKVYLKNLVSYLTEVKKIKTRNKKQK